MQCIFEHALAGHKVQSKSHLFSGYEIVNEGEQKGAGDTGKRCALTHPSAQPTLRTRLAVLGVVAELWVRNFRCAPWLHLDYRLCCALFNRDQPHQQGVGADRQDGSVGYGQRHGSVRARNERRERESGGGGVVDVPGRILATLQRKFWDSNKVPRFKNSKNGFESSAHFRD